MAEFEEEEMRFFNNTKKCPRHGLIGGCYMTVHLPSGNASWCIICLEELMANYGVCRVYESDDCPELPRGCLTLATQRTGGLPPPKGEREVPNG